MRLQNRFHMILRKYRHLNWDEQTLSLYERDLDEVLHDFWACKNCDGHHCRTSFNMVEVIDMAAWAKTGVRPEKSERKYEFKVAAYMGMYDKAIKATGKPCVAVHYCPGPQARKAEMESEQYAGTI